jgi:protein-S-isoprenylcysteine O-methyltransferase Ste14
VLLASLILLLLYWQWQRTIVWSIQNPSGRTLLQGLFWIG